MAFAQLTSRESLRDIEIRLHALQRKLYHADFARVLIAWARRLYQADDFGAPLKHTAYALDSTTIDLCLTLFPWAQFRRHKAAVKFHTLIDLRGNIPCFVRITHGKTHDVAILDVLPIEPGAFYVMDRAYLDFGRLLWDFAERREDAGLDRDQHLQAGGHHSQGTKYGTSVARNLADLERLSFRENPYKRGSFSRKTHCFPGITS